MTLFSDLKLDPKVLQAVTDAGYHTPTPIQAGAIPPALEGRDVLGIAQTGTGKTASFTLPMITLLGRGRARARMPRSLVLCPTRELAAQVAENFDTYAKHTKLTKALLIGGVSFGEQDKLIDRGVDVLIATPGRLLDHFERGKLLLTGVQIMVVDEADRMLDMGFIPDIERIFQLTPFTRQTLFFSATMAPEIERITNTFLHSPERIEVARQATASETITQRLVEITPTRRDQTAKQKRELLRALIDAEGEGLKNAIIFCNRKTEVDIVAKSLKRHGYDAAPIHGDLDQRHRMATLDGFREGTLRFLIASDVAARGLDIPAVSHVFNFDLPSHAEDYVHRIGRTGRAGRQGIAISLCVPADEKYLAAIEDLVKQALPRSPVPEGFSLSEAAQSAPRADRGPRGGRDHNGGRERGERGRRGERREDRREERREEKADPMPVIEPVVSEDVMEHRGDRGDRREERGERRDRREDRGERGERREDRGERSERREDRGERSDRREDRRGGRDRDGRRDNPVMGLGDHVPEFMLQVFRPGYRDTPETAAETAAPQEVTPVETSAEESVEKPKPAKSRRRRKPAAEVTPEAVSEAPVEATPVEAEAAPETADEAPKAERPKRTRRRKADTEAAPEAAPAAETVEEAPKSEKPKRSRKKAETAEGEAEAKPRARKSRAKTEGDAETAEKPKRSRKKTAPEAEAPAEG